VAASAFGAGFGGSVWALVQTDAVSGFVERWRRGYEARFPQAAARGAFLTTRPGPAALEL
jgi:galactokinase